MKNYIEVQWSLEGEGNPVRLWVMVVCGTLASLAGGFLFFGQEILCLIFN